MKVDLSVNLGPLKLKNPVLTASGCFGYGLEFEDVVDLNRLGGILTKGISLKPRSGNPVVRIAETYGGMLNSIGLQNVGLDAFIKDKIPPLKKYDTAVIVNIFGETEDEYLKLAGELNAAEHIAALEVNISCPNVKKGGIQFGTDANAVHSLTKNLKKVSRFPIIMKLTPNVTDICEIALASEEGGADILSLVNTFRGMAVDIEKRKPVLATTYGGLSGPCIKPLALAMLHQVATVVKIPLIGMGGIMNVRDVLEFLITGASAVQVGTANFIKSDITMDIVEGLKDHLEKNGIKRISDLIGTIS